MAEAPQVSHRMEAATCFFEGLFEDANALCTHEVERLLPLRYRLWEGGCVSIENYVLQDGVRPGPRDWRVMLPATADNVRRLQPVIHIGSSGCHGMLKYRFERWVSSSVPESWEYVHVSGSHYLIFRMIVDCTFELSRTMNENCVVFTLVDRRGNQSFCFSFSKQRAVIRVSDVEALCLAALQRRNPTTWSCNSMVYLVWSFGDICDQRAVLWRAGTQARIIYIYIYVMQICAVTTAHIRFICKL
jgi:hypothetical protein